MWHQFDSQRNWISDNQAEFFPIQIANGRNNFRRPSHVTVRTTTSTLDLLSVARVAAGAGSDFC